MLRFQLAARWGLVIHVLFAAVRSFMRDLNQAVKSAKQIAPVGAVSISRPNKQIRMFVEVFPREILDVIAEPLKHVSDLGGSINDSCGYKTLHDAIIDTQGVRSRLLRYVKPENLLFVFVESLEALYRFPLDAADVEEGHSEHGKPTCDGHDDNAARNQEYSPDVRAKLLIKVVQPEFGDPFGWSEQVESTGYGDNCEIPWSELQCLGEAFDHAVIFSANVRSMAA